jgi:hypothetical protein
MPKTINVLKAEAIGPLLSDMQMNVDAAGAARGFAEIALAGAEAALAGAEVARDATTLIAATSGAYPSTPDTLANAIAEAVGELAVGNTFTATGTDVDYIGLYKVLTGPVASDAIARYASNANFPAVQKPPFPAPIVDSAGYAADAVNAGYKSSFGLSDCDRLVLWGDSITEGSSAMQSKSWAAVLGSLTPYRVQGKGISGQDIGEWYRRLQDNRETNAQYGTTSEADLNNIVSGQYHVVIIGQNDGSISKYRQNLRSFIILLRARGAEIVLMTMPMSSGSALEVAQHHLCYAFAAEFGLEVIEGSSRRNELRFNAGPFTDGVHVSTKTGVIYWSIMADWLARAPRPRRSIKVYSGRNAGANLATLLFGLGDDYELSKVFKEIDCRNPAINDPAEYDEYTKRAPGNSTWVLDQYESLRGPNGITLGDYVLIRASLPATAATLEGAAIEVQSDATTAYVLDRFANDVSDSDTPPGEWRAATYANGHIRFGRQLLLQTMSHNEVFVLLHRSGGVTLGAPRVHYSATLEQVPARAVRNTLPRSLIREAVTAARANFDVTGLPAEVVPFDLTIGAPRLPGTTSPITGVLEITNANKIGGSEAVTLAQTGTYKVTVWARYWPKPFFNHAHYPAWPAEQIIDRMAPGVTFEANSPVQPHTWDMRRLRLTAEVKTLGAIPNVEFRQDKTVGMYWMPVSFLVDAPPGTRPGFLSWSLSCPDGTIQLGKVKIEEVEAYVTRA